MKFNDLVYRLKETDSNLVIMVGPPLSGKTTLINQIREYCQVISRDDIVMELGNGLSYEKAFNTVSQKEVSAKLRSKISQAGKTNENVVIDMTNLRPKSRKGHLKKFPNHTKIALAIEALPLEKLLERNEKRLQEENKFIPVDVVENMLESYIFPTKEEGFDHIVKSVSK